MPLTNRFCNVELASHRHSVLRFCSGRGAQRLPDKSLLFSITVRSRLQYRRVMQGLGDPKKSPNISIVGCVSGLMSQK